MHTFGNLGVLLQEMLVFSVGGIQETRETRCVHVKGTREIFNGKGYH